MSNSKNEEILPEILSEYMNPFEEKSIELSDKISTIEEEIEELKVQIKESEKSLKKNIAEINSKKKQVNVRLHGISGDYDEEDLLEAAETLKRLKEEKVEIEEEIKGQTDDLKEKLSLQEEMKNDASSAKEKVEEIKADTSKKLKDVYSDYEKKLEAINKALEVCDNEYLQKALEDEKAEMKIILTDIYNESKSMLGDELDTLKPKKTKKKDSFEEIKFKEEPKKRRSIKKAVEEKIEIENPEPSFSEIEEEKLEMPEISEIEEEIPREEPKIEEPVENIKIDIPEEVTPIVPEVPEPTNTLEEIENANREVIAKVDATDKADLVKNSGPVKRSIENFFISPMI